MSKTEEEIRSYYIMGTVTVGYCVSKLIYLTRLTPHICVEELGAET